VSLVIINYRYFLTFS